MADVEIGDALVEVFVRARVGADPEHEVWADDYLALLRRSVGWEGLRAGLAAVAAHLRAEWEAERAESAVAATKGPGHHTTPETAGSWLSGDYSGPHGQGDGNG